MRKTSFAALALIALAVASPVRGQDMTPPGDPPAAGSEELRKRILPLPELLRHCENLKRAAAGALDDYPCPSSCDPDDRACEVITKMRRRPRDSRIDDRWLKRK